MGKVKNYFWDEIMARPQYERRTDIEHENAARPVIEKSFSCEIKKLDPHKYGFDWMLYKGKKAFACAEYKRRWVGFNDYPFIILSAAKFWRAITFGQMLEKGFYFFVEFDDGLYGAPFRMKPESISNFFNIGWGGRTDRNDAADAEPVVEIPISKFYKL